MMVTFNSGAILGRQVVVRMQFGWLAEGRVTSDAGAGVAVLRHVQDCHTFAVQGRPFDLALAAV